MTIGKKVLMETNLQSKLPEPSAPGLAATANTTGDASVVSVSVLWHRDFWRPRTLCIFAGGFLLGHGDQLGSLVSIVPPVLVTRPPSFLVALFSRSPVSQLLCELNVREKLQPPHTLPILHINRWT